MKISKVIATALLSVFMLVLGSGNVLSNSLRSDKDSLDCLQQLSVASLALEKDMHQHALASWRSLFTNCPDISVRIYSDGVKLWEHYIGKTEDETLRQAYVDTLLMVYDKRLEFFGDHEKYSEGWILGRKGMEIVKYRRGNIHSLQDAYDCFSKSFFLMKEKTEPAVLVTWIQTAKKMNEHGIVSDDSFLSDYLNVYELVENKKFQDKYNSAISQKINGALVSILQKSEISDCNSFNLLLNSSEKGASLTYEKINMYLEMMEISGCKESNLYTELVEQKYELNPTPVAAMDLARMFVRERNFDKAADFYREAASKTTEDSLKAVCYYELAVLTDGHFKKPVDARQYAKRASSLMPHWGQPHLLLGSIYARESVNLSGDDFEKNAVYWVVVDQFMDAMRKDNSCKEEALKQIEVYAQYFPDKQTCFFHGLDEGQEFIVGDWINEPTTVRYR